MKTIDREGLERWTREHQPFALLDVLPDCAGMVEQSMHTAEGGADFRQHLRSLHAPKEQPIVLYEAATAPVHSSTAAELLELAGFPNVYRFIGPQSALHAGGHAPAAEKEV